MSTWVPSPSPSEREPHQINDSLDRITRRLGGPSASDTRTVFTSWEELVGADIASHSQPVSLRAGVLTLSVDHPAWATQLRYMTAELIRRIAEATTSAAVTEIRLRVTGEPVPEAPFRRRRQEAQDDPRGDGREKGR